MNQLNIPLWGLFISSSMGLISGILAYHTIVEWGHEYKYADAKVGLVLGATIGIGFTVTGAIIGSLTSEAGWFWGALIIAIAFPIIAGNLLQNQRISFWNVLVIFSATLSLLLGIFLVFSLFVKVDSRDQLLLGFSVSIFITLLAAFIQALVRS